MFKRMPFGISLAIDEFQAKVAALLGDMEGVEVIIDDVLVHGKTKHEPDAGLKTVLDAMKGVGLQLNKDKCRFARSEVCLPRSFSRSWWYRTTPREIQSY